MRLGSIPPLSHKWIYRWYKIHTYNIIQHTFLWQYAHTVSGFFATLNIECFISFQEPPIHWVITHDGVNSHYKAIKHGEDNAFEKQRKELSVEAIDGHALNRQIFQRVIHTSFIAATNQLLSKISTLSRCKKVKLSVGLIMPSRHRINRIKMRLMRKSSIVFEILTVGEQKFKKKRLQKSPSNGAVFNIVKSNSI